MSCVRSGGDALRQVGELDGGRRLADVHVDQRGDAAAELHPLGGRRFAGAGQEFEQDAGAVAGRRSFAAGTVRLNRTMPSLPGSIEQLRRGDADPGGWRRYGPSLGHPSNCGEPSRDRSQSVSRARTRTGSVPPLFRVTAWVLVLPGPAWSSTRSGETSTDTWAARGEAGAKTIRTARKRRTDGGFRARSG